MPIDRRLDSSSRVLWTTAHGLVTVDDVRRHFVAVRDMSAHACCEVIDASRAEPAFGVRDLRRLAEDGRVVDILEMSPCSQDPCPTYASSASYTQAVEMNVTAATTPAVTEANRRPAAQSPRVVSRAKAAVTVLPARAPSHQFLARIMASRLSISVPMAMLPYTLCGKNVIRPCW